MAFLVPGKNKSFILYVNEFAFRLNEGNVRVHTLSRLENFTQAAFGKHLSYKELTA
jgi:hypothetical protein